MLVPVGSTMAVVDGILPLPVTIIDAFADLTLVYNFVMPLRTKAVTSWLLYFTVLVNSTPRFMA